MKSKCIIEKEEIEEINIRFGGNIRNDAEIETALILGKGKSIYKKIAYLWRAILVGHPYTDGNKRTALAVALILFESCGEKLDKNQKESLLNEIRNISSENITEVQRIERLIRYAVTKR